MSQWSDERDAADHTKRDWLPLLLFALALSLGIATIGHESFWIDEQWSREFATRESVASVVNEVAQHDVHPPLYYVTLHFWSRVFGADDISLRMPSALFSAVTASVIYLIGRTLAGRSVGLAAGLLFCVMPWRLYYAQDARQYALLGLLVALLLLATTCMRRTGARFLLVSAALGAAASAVHWYGMIAAVTTALVIAWNGSHSRLARLREGAGPMLGAGLVLGIWSPFLIRQLSQAQGHISGLPLRQLAAVRAYPIVEVSPARSTVAVGLGTLLLLFGSAYLIRSRNAPSGWQVTMPAYSRWFIQWSAIAVAFIAVVSLLREFWVGERIIALMLPPGALVVGAALIHANKRRFGIVSVLAVAVLIGHGVFSFYGADFNKPQWRQATRYVSQEVPPPGPILTATVIRNSEIVQNYAGSEMCVAHVPDSHEPFAEIDCPEDTRRPTRVAIIADAWEVSAVTGALPQYDLTPVTRMSFGRAVTVLIVEGSSD